MVHRKAWRFAGKTLRTGDANVILKNHLMSKGLSKLPLVRLRWLAVQDSTARVMLPPTQFIRLLGKSHPILGNMTDASTRLGDISGACKRGLGGWGLLEDVMVRIPHAFLLKSTCRAW